MPDARVSAAIEHWAARFTANGVVLSDFQEVTAAIADWSQWCRAWSVRAALHEALGRAALAAGKHLSAGEHLNRAGLYYHFGKFLFVHDPPQMKAAHLKSIECHELALPHLDPPGERVVIAYQGKRLAGVLRRPKGKPRAPIVVMIMGLDSAKEEMAAYENDFLARGLAVLAFDGPGQGEGEYDFAIRGDYEVAIDAVLEWLETRADIDAARIGLWGVSLGGYYAPRAAAFEKRIRACVALSGPYDFGALWDQLPELTRAAFRARSRSADDAEARQRAGELNLRGVARRIGCPLYIVAGKLDRICPAEDARRLAAEATGPVELVVVEDGTHVVNNRPYRYRPQTADWLAEKLGA